MAMKKRRWHRHLAKLPEHRWITAAEMNDILKSNGVEIMTRTLSSLLSASSVAKQGIQMRHVANNSREYRIHSMNQLLDYIR